MADITKYPLIDKFETTLAQSWDGSTGDVYLNTLPTFTFPSGVTTYIVVNPGKSNMQVAEINSMNSNDVTVNVTSIDVDKWAWTSYTAQSHSVGSVVRISNNYQFWKDVVDSVNSKVDTNDQIDFNYYSDATARDADIPSPTVGKDYAFLADTWLLYYYGSGWWTAFDTGTAVSNASETVAGIVEQATTAEMTAGTETGDTGAKLFTSPDVIQASIQSWEALYAWASSVWTDAYAVSLTPAITAYTTGMSIIFKADVANTGACTIDVNSVGVKSIKTVDGNDPQDGAIRVGQLVQLVYDGTNFVMQNEDSATTTNKGIVEKATPTETLNGTADKYPDAKEISDTWWTEIVAWDSNTLATSSATVDSNWSSNASYEKKREIEVDAAWTYKANWSIEGNWSNVSVKSRIYVNGSAVSGEFDAGGDSLISYSYDVTVSAWDLVQLYTYRDGGTSTYKVLSMNLQYSVALIRATATVNSV